MKIAFQGTRGAYSEEALYQFFGETKVEAVGYELSEQVGDALESEEVAMGILPVENSIAGNVAINMDLLYQHRFFVIGELYLPIHHCLMARPGVHLKDLKTVHSHPVALEQCRDFLNKHNIKAIPDFDTAGASKNLVERKSVDQGTISSRLCAEYYGLEILDDDVQKVKHNITRFQVFVKEDHIPDGIRQEKTSIAFSTKHHPGALLGCLQQFAKADINLTRLESRPIPENPFAYVFFVDFMGALTDKKVIETLRNLKEDASHIKVLGSYPVASK
ncbi:MAG: prephenate dehydratase [Bacteriovoracaceae bacterium]|jgi:prephenate dehydratase